MKKHSLAALVTACAVVAPHPADAELRDMTKNVAGTTVRYKVVLPDGYDPTKGGRTGRIPVAQ